MNEKPIDWWSVVHAASGAGLALGGASLPVATTILVVYEIAEYAVEYPRGSKLFGSKRPESTANMAMDLAIGLGAFALTRHYTKGRRS